MKDVTGFPCPPLLLAWIWAVTYFILSLSSFLVWLETLLRQLVPQAALSTVLCIELGIFVVLFLLFQTPHCSQKCKLAHFSQGQLDKMPMSTSLAKEAFQCREYVIPYFSKSMFKRIFFLSPLLSL